MAHPVRQCSVALNATALRAPPDVGSPWWSRWRRAAASTFTPSFTSREVLHLEAGRSFGPHTTAPHPAGAAPIAFGEMASSTRPKRGAASQPKPSPSRSPAISPAGPANAASTRRRFSPRCKSCPCNRGRAADYDGRRDEAERRIAARDPDDWPTVIRPSATAPAVSAGADHHRVADCLDHPAAAGERAGGDFAAERGGELGQRRPRRPPRSARVAGTVGEDESRALLLAGALATTVLLTV
jgi:hypothetical protein